MRLISKDIEHILTGYASDTMHIWGLTNRDISRIQYEDDFFATLNFVSGNLAQSLKPAPKTQIRQSGIPQSDIPTAVRKTERKPAPSDLDVAMSNRYGSNIETVQKLQQTVQNQETFETYIPMDLD